MTEGSETMGKRETDSLHGCIRRLVAKQWPANRIVDVSHMSDQLALECPGSGLSHFEISAEIVLRLYESRQDHRRAP